MNLHGEFFLRVEEFEKEREARQDGRTFSKHLGAEFRPEFVQCFVAQRACMHHALRLLAVHDLPRFADADVVRDFFSKHGFEAASAPDALHEKRFKIDGLGEVHF